MFLRVHYQLDSWNAASTICLSQKTFWNWSYCRPVIHSLQKFSSRFQMHPKGVLNPVKLSTMLGHSSSWAAFTRCAMCIKGDDSVIWIGLADVKLVMQPLPSRPMIRSVGLQMSNTWRQEERSSTGICKIQNHISVKVLNHISVKTQNHISVNI